MTSIMEARKKVADHEAALRRLDSAGVKLPYARSRVVAGLEQAQRELAFVLRADAPPKGEK